ncbi:MAG: ABC transporter ATP-binding protein [Magnetococcales bacterium]|nr:ABC transporter ATP-binding protein [Magnetococcales bacterium]
MIKKASYHHILATDLKKSFLALSGKKTTVLNGISFNIGCGEIVSLLGPSGCGKSTILNIVAGLTTFDGLLEISDYLDDKGIGYIFQTPRLIPWLTIEENIKIVMDKNEKTAGEMVSDYLSLANLNGLEDAYPGELSGGMKTRAAIARALSIRPSILLCDEPFSSIDEITAMKIRDEIQRIWLKNKFSILFVTHNPQEAAFLSDRVLILSKRPANIVEEIIIGLDRPRKIGSYDLMRATSEIIDKLQRS